MITKFANPVGLVYSKLGDTSQDSMPKFIGFSPDNLRLGRYTV
jgi:hypothetical protein